MLYAYINNQYRRPMVKGERAACSTCGGELIAVLPTENVAHWRHRSKDCDPWSEPEGEWHLAWKEKFPVGSREVVLRNPESAEFHRADVFHISDNGMTTTLELQFSPINDDEREKREAFYLQRGRMYWLVHIHDSQSSFTGTNLGLAFSIGSEEFEHLGKQFQKLHWVGRSKQFIEKWNRSRAHVFFSYRGYLLYLATHAASKELVSKQKKGEFAVTFLSEETFLASILNK